MPRLLEKSVLFEETLAKPFPPGLLSYPAVTAAKVGLPFLPGSEAAFVNLCLLPFGCLVLGSLEGRSKERGHSSLVQAGGLLGALVLGGLAAPRLSPCSALTVAGPRF